MDMTTAFVLAAGVHSEHIRMFLQTCLAAFALIWAGMIVVNSINLLRRGGKVEIEKQITAVIGVLLLCMTIITLVH